MIGAIVSSYDSWWKLDDAARILGFWSLKIWKYMLRKTEESKRSMDNDMMIVMISNLDRTIYDDELRTLLRLLMGHK